MRHEPQNHKRVRGPRVTIHIVYYIYVRAAQILREAPLTPGGGGLAIDCIGYVVYNLWSSREAR